MRLVIGSLNYSSWSTRAWLALDHAGAEFRTHELKMFDVENPDWRDAVLAFSGAGKVPILIDGSLSVHEALAICEYVAEKFPAAQLWPEDMQLRARARAISSEMATGYSHLRNELNMHNRGRAKGFEPSAGARAEIARVFDIWSASLQTSGGPFLFGDFSIADCMYAPLLSRFRTYGVALDADAARYAEAMWAQPSVQRWQALAADATAMPIYDGAEAFA